MPCMSAVSGAVRCTQMYNGAKTSICPTIAIDALFCPYSLTIWTSTASQASLECKQHSGVYEADSEPIDQSKDAI